MKTRRIIIGSLVFIMIAMLLVPPGAMAQEPGASEETDGFSKEELTQMLAPIALYPDSLVAEMLIASTYPLEIVEAERWLRQNKELKGDTLNAALQEKTWPIETLFHKIANDVIGQLMYLLAAGRGDVGGTQRNISDLLERTIGPSREGQHKGAFISGQLRGRQNVR